MFERQMFKKIMTYTFRILILTWSFYSCEKTIVEESYYVTNYGGTLNHPDSLPRIIFTNPSNNATGPFEVEDPTLEQTSPRITIQFNKLVNIYDINEHNVSLRSGADTYELILSDQYYGNYNYEYEVPNLRDILIFNVETSYRANKEYILTIDKTLKDIHGYPLNKTYTISYSPEPDFRVTHVSPTGSDVEPRDFSRESTYMYIRFNSPVDSTIFEKLSIDPPLSGDWSYKTPYGYLDSTRVNFLSTDALAFDSEYTVSIAKDAVDYSDSKIKSPYQYSFTTAPFSVRWSSASFSSNRLSYVVFDFNGAVDTSTVRSAISVTPHLDYDIEFYIRNNEPCEQIKLSFYNAEFTANALYEIQLDKTIRSANGAYLKEPYIYTYQTHKF